MENTTREQRGDQNIFVFHKKFIIIVTVGFLFLAFGVVAFHLGKQSTNNAQNYYPTVVPISTSPSIIPTNSIQLVEDENIKKCVSDQGAYIGGCSQDYVCFEQGNDQGCSRGKDCSKIKFNPVGDNKCHKSCQSNKDCLSGYNCLGKEVWHGDYSKTYKLCLIEKNTDTVKALFPLDDPNANYFIWRNRLYYQSTIHPEDSTSALISSDTTIDLYGFRTLTKEFKDPRRIYLTVKGTFITEKVQNECIQAPCPPMDGTVIHIDSVRIK